LQLASYSFEEWSTDLHMQVLPERADLGHIP
jgi:hypothetical protein